MCEGRMDREGAVLGGVTRHGRTGSAVLPRETGADPRRRAEDGGCRG